MSDSLARRGLARAAARLNANGIARARLPSLILMTDDERSADPLAAAQRLPRGSLVIVRSRSSARRVELTAALMDLARSRALFVLVADDTALARDQGADGIHLPERRASEAGHWRACNPRWLITVAAHSLGALARARCADAVLLSALFATQSHLARTPLSPARANLIARQSCLPLYALGGIGSRNAKLISGENYAGIAAISALGC